MAKPMVYIESGDFEAAKNYLKAKPLQINQSYSWGQTCLMYAARKGDPEFLNWIISAGANVEACDDRGRTALHFAVVWRQLEAVTILLKCGSEINRKDKYGNTPLHLAVRSIFFEEWKEGMEVLLQSQEIEVNQQNNKGHTPLHIASSNGCAKLVGLLLNRADINANVVDKGGNTPLHLAVRNQRYDVVTLMLSQDSVKMDMKNHQQMTPLLQAVRLGNLGMMTRLIVRGSDVNATDDNGNNCLLISLQTEMFHSGDAAIAILDKCCAELNLEKKEKFSGIVVARYLASRGANFYHKNDQNKTPLDLIGNQKLKKKIKAFLPPQCLWCKTKAATIKFHPCEHLVTCEKCSKVTFKRCFVCQEPVTSRSGFVSPKFVDKGVQTDPQLLAATSQQAESPKSMNEQDQSVAPTSESKLQQVESPELTEKLLNGVVQHLGGKWQQVGIELGIKNIQLEIIRNDHLQNTVEQSFQMLFRWFRKCDPETRTLKTLRDALEKCECFEALNRLPQTK